MCGIAGLVSVDVFDSRALLTRMLDALNHRGPDGSGMIIEDQFALGMTRLAIIDLNFGDQPIYSEDQAIAVVCNGEIYNYKELRKELEKRGHNFSTQSDTEVIVHLYEEHGNDCARFLDGMFAFAVYDRRKKQILLGRDRLGIKPLYLARSSRGLLFASELKALIEDSTLERRIEPTALEFYLSYTYVPGRRTFFSEIEKFPPGHVALIDADGKITYEAFWKLDTTLDTSKTRSDWLGQLEEQALASIRSHLVSDVPLGIFLSGGVDSGLVGSLASIVSERPVQSFTVGFSDSGKGFLDERLYAAELAEKYGFEHHEIEVAASLPEIVDDLTQAFDEPFADDSVIPTFYLCRETSKHVKVALSGLGGDELFAGYRRHLGLVLGGLFQSFPIRLRQDLIEPIVRRLPESAESNHTVDHLKRFIRSSDSLPPERYQNSLVSIQAADLAGILRAKNGAEVVPYPAVADAIISHMSGSPDLINSALFTDIKTYLVDDILALNDRLSMHHSLEVRVPFLDHHLVELAMTIPQQFKIRRFSQKYILKELARKYLPRRILNHRKQGFESPMARWIRGPLRNLVDDFLDPAYLRDQGIFDARKVRELVERHRQLQQQNSKVIFSLIMFQAWYRRFGISF